MTDEQNCIERIYTYTYDQFTVFFHDDHVFIGGKEYPIGQCCVDIVNQEKLNAVWDIVFSLPVYRDLKMDEACNYHAFQRLMADKEKWVQDPASQGCAGESESHPGAKRIWSDLQSFEGSETEGQD